MPLRLSRRLCSLAQISVREIGAGEGPLRADGRAARGVHSHPQCDVVVSGARRLASPPNTNGRRTNFLSTAPLT